MVYCKVLDVFDWEVKKATINLAIESIINDFELKNILDEKSIITFNGVCIKKYLQYTAANKILES